jgi:hypothetical protein
MQCQAPSTAPNGRRFMRTRRSLVCARLHSVCGISPASDVILMNSGDVPETNVERNVNSLCISQSLLRASARVRSLRATRAGDAGRHFPRFPHIYVSSSRRESSGLGIRRRIRQAIVFGGSRTGRLNSVHSRCSAAEMCCPWLLNPIRSRAGPEPDPKSTSLPNIGRRGPRGCIAFASIRSY